MKRINEVNINTPEMTDAAFAGTFGVTDMNRQRRLAKYFKGGVYADVGCFDSPMPALLAEHYGSSAIYAFDHAPNMVAWLASRFPKVHYQIANCYELPIPDAMLDCVVAGELIEHLEEPQKAITEWMRVLKPGGWLAISTPLEEQNHDVGGPQHLWQWTLEDMTLLGFTEVEVETDGHRRTILAWQQKK